MNGGVIREDQLHAESWNGVPVTMGHPKDAQGNDISANSPEVLSDWAVGTIFNANVNNGKLKGEAWVNVSKVDQQLLNKLESMEAIDVSTGYFSDIENNQYKDIKPDHLALLPNQQGACSYSDGCGVRSNQSLSNELVNNIKRFFSMDTDKMSDHTRLYLHEKGYGEMMQAVQSKLDDMDTDRKKYYLVDMFEDKIIYKVRMEDDKEYYQRDYTMEDGTVMLGDNIQQVQKETNYKPITNGSNMIDTLISNEDTPFNEGDKESLEAMSDCTLKALSDKYLSNEEDEAEEVETQKESNEEKDVLSNEDKEAISFARNQYKEHREQLIAHIKTNSNMEVEKLEGMTTNTLETIAGGLEEKSVNYGGRSFGTNKGGGNDEDVIQAMTPNSTADVIANKNKEVN